MKYQRYNAYVSRLSSERGSQERVKKKCTGITSLEFSAPWTTALADNGKFCVQYEVRSMKIQVTGQTILFTDGQLEKVNKPFNIQQGKYIGKPQTLHSACC